MCVFIVLQKINMIEALLTTQPFDSNNTLWNLISGLHRHNLLDIHRHAKLIHTQDVGE